MSKTSFRIHPSVGFARVGTSASYYLAPETLTGHPQVGTDQTGGLPIKAGTENTPITSSDIRGEDGGLARQGARFRVYFYETDDSETYPMGSSGKEIAIGDCVNIDGRQKTVTNILWTVHMANKKTAWYASADDDGILAWGEPGTPTTPTEGIRNGFLSDDPTDPRRLNTMVIDPGPRTIQGQGASTAFDRTTQASVGSANGKVTPLPDYPKMFPRESVAALPATFPDSPERSKFDGKLYPEAAPEIDSLGDLHTDDKGRLTVVGATGRANSFNNVRAQHGFVDAVNNDWWFDDTGDGPVDAVIEFDDGTTHTVEGAAWVISTDPAYAPQIANIVSLWDDIHDSFVRKLALRPDLYTNGSFVSNYQASFEDEVRPIFLAAGLQRWVTNLTQKGIVAHEHIEKISEDTLASQTPLAGLGLIREPVEPGEPYPESTGDRKRMPLALGDAGRSLLSISKTQYQYLKYWDDDAMQKGKRIAINHGELMDKSSFLACLGGRFGPGIDMTYICREPDIWVQDWQKSGTGPFRISAKPLNYSPSSSAPVLTIGWTPKRNETQLEPGDVSKFMAIPWHADYNSCGNHLPSPNIEQNNQLYWSWPAQRPLTVYAAADIRDGKGLTETEEGGSVRERQRFSMRGDFTKTVAPNPSNPPPFGPGNPAEVGRYQETPTDETSTDPGIARILDHWMKIGVVIQGTNIDDGGKYQAAHYLEVGSQLDDEPSDAVQPWDKDRVPASSFKS